jgi:hypothetical protein
MMKNFMTPGSLTQGRELEEDLGGSDVTPFLGEDAVMTVYDGHPLPGFKLSMWTPTRCGWGPRDKGA